MRRLINWLGYQLKEVYDGDDEPVPSLFTAFNFILIGFILGLVAAVIAAQVIMLVTR
jgi:cell division protein FtsX